MSRLLNFELWKATIICATILLIISVFILLFLQKYLFVNYDQIIMELAEPQGFEVINKILTKNKNTKFDYIVVSKRNNKKGSTLVIETNKLNEMGKEMSEYYVWALVKEELDSHYNTNNLKIKFSKIYKLSPGLSQSQIISLIEDRFID